MMRTYSPFALLFALLCAIPASTMLLGCGGCSLGQSDQHSTEIRAALSVRDLTEGARQIYAQLAFNQAVHDQDVPLLLESLVILEEESLPASTYAEAAVVLGEKNAPELRAVLEKGLKKFPEDALLNILLGEYLLREGDADEGTAHMRRYLLRHPHNKEARVELALLLIKNGHFQEAAHILGAIPDKERSGFIEMQYARALTGLHRDDEAILHLKKALSLTPDYVEAMAELATLYDKNNRREEAVAVYEKIRDTGTGTQALYLRLVQLALQMKAPDRALKYVKQGPGDTEFQLRAASLFLEQGYVSQTENLLKSIAKKEDAPKEILLDLARLAYFEQKNPRLALTWLEKISGDDKIYPEAVLLEIQALFDLDQKQQALELVRKCAARHQDIPEIREAEIRVLIALDREEEALAATRKALSQWPESRSLALLLGTLLDLTGDDNAAITAMERVLELDPDNTQALNYIGYTLALQGRDLNRALSLLEKAVRIAPERSHIWDSLAWAQFKSRHYKDAWRSIQRSITTGGSKEPEIWEHYGDIALALGKKNEARTGYRKALELNPSNAQAIAAKLSTL